MKRTLALLALLLGLAQAQRYTVQTVALKDYRDALETSASLRGLGFDAYVDFGMFENHQFARVRVGCYEDRDSAAAMAATLADGFTAEAVVADASPVTPTDLCLRREVGFELPQSWDVLESTPSAVAYSVEILGHRGYVVFTGERWRLAQDEAEATALMSAPVLASAAPPRFQALTIEGRPYVAVLGAAGSTVIARGQLLWQSAGAAVVLEGTAVVAYHVAGSAP